MNINKIKQRLYIILENDPKKEDTASVIVNQFLFFLICFNIAAVILETFNVLPEYFAPYLHYFEIFSVVIFTIEYLIRLLVSPYKPPSLSAKKAFLAKLPPYVRYIISPMALIDFLAIIPFYLPFISGLFGFRIDLRFLRVLRLVRLIRVFKLSRYDKTSKLLSKVLDNALQGLANIIEHRDMESGQHVKRTQLYVKAIIDYLIDTESVYARELRSLQPDIIMRSMALHDVGKIAIPDRILCKPGKFEPEEYEIMKTHTTKGKNIVHELGDVNSSIYLKHCEDICHGHHERWDGKGYPQQLKENEIPLAARIAALADVYDALVCARVYKSAMAYEEAIRIITEGRGTQFDPIIVDVVIQIQDKFKEIAQNYK